MILFVNNLMIGYSYREEKMIPERLLNKEVLKPRLKFNPWLALISF